MRFLIAAFIFSILFSCSSTRSKRVLSFFFDGVSLNDSSLVSDKNPSSYDSVNSEVFRPVAIVSNSGFVVHYPYQEKECNSCHDEKSKSELILPQPDLCYTCHDDYSRKYKGVHGPVASGYCTACHNAHMSKEKGLLVRTGQQLCLFCHDPGPLYKSETHKDISDTECTLCHNPHGGEDRYILN